MPGLQGHRHVRLWDSDDKDRRGGGRGFEEEMGAANRYEEDRRFCETAEETVVDTDEVWSRNEAQSHISAGRMCTIENIMDSFGYYTEWSRILIRYVRDHPHIL